MRRRYELDPAGLTPAAGAVLARQGVPPRAVTPRVAAVAAEAVSAVRRLARPVGLELDVDDATLTQLLAVAGTKAAETTVDRVRPRARRLALFAVTLGEPVSALAGELFGRDDYALGAMVDAAASITTEKAVAAVELAFAARLATEGIPAAEAQVLGYSPGYCGWHTHALRPLFALLEPVDLGLELGDSCLMHPLKSCAGLLVAGTVAAHRFAPDFEFCRTCAEPTCRRRVRELERRTLPGGSP